MKKIYAMFALLLVLCMIGDFEPKTEPQSEENIKVEQSIDNYIKLAHTEEKPPKTMEFIATGYCSCPKCCGKYSPKDGQPAITASGEVAVAGTTIASDWEVLPVYSRVEIEGMGRYIVHDKGGAIKGNRIDIYFASHDEAVRFGKQKVNVIIWED